MKRLRPSFVNVILPLLACGLLAYALLSILNRQAPPVAEPTLPPPSAPFDGRVAGIGIVEPESESISIGTQVPGIVAEVTAKVGDKVKAGDILFTLDSRQAQADLELSGAQYEAARVQAADATHQLALYENVSDKRAISADELSRRRFAAELAERRLKEAEARIDVASTQFDLLAVRAPIDAEVLRVNVRPGEFAAAGALSTPLLILGNTSVMHVRVEVDETDALRVKPGAKAVGTLRGYTAKPIMLSFVRKEPFVIPKRSLTGDGNERVDTRVQEILYAFDNKDIGAFVGQQMDIFIEAESLTGKPSRE